MNIYTRDTARKREKERRERKKIEGSMDRYKRDTERKRKRERDSEIEGSMDRWKTRRKYICKKY